MFHVPEEFRVISGAGNFNSTKEDGNNGVFVIPAKRYKIRAIVSGSEDWEHVSIPLSNGRTPNWKEMCAIKDLFWDPVDAVMQIHPPISEYINNHPNCLHLWRPTDQPIPQPPSYMVGSKSLNKER